MNQPLFLKPVFHERIWGGTTLKSKFDYEISSELTGECWAISAHPNGQSTVRNGEHAGKTVGELWEEKREWFGDHPSPVFPLLTKILDANDDLSVQVHPGDDYAKENENGELGKTECWYVIDCDEDAELIFGHRAGTKEEFERMIEMGQWEDLLQRVPIKPGDFFYVPSGTIHALCKGTLVLETQQSSDTTYRLYDYDRRDQEGKTRELHIRQSIDVTSIPHESPEVKRMVEKRDGAEITTYVQADYFTVYKWSIHGRSVFQQDQLFQLASVIEGGGTLHVDGVELPLNKGDHFILPSGMERFELEGNMEIIVSHV